MDSYAAGLTPDNAIRKAIESFDFDKGSPQMGFVEKLGLERGWTKAQSRRAIAEYRRFAFIAAGLGQSAVPSRAVDSVWKTHQTMTESYAELAALMPGGAFARPPALGSPGSRDKASGGPGMPNAASLEAYKTTLARYKAEFGDWPDGGWWEKPETRFGFAPRRMMDGREKTWSSWWGSGRGALPFAGAAAAGLVLAMPLGALVWRHVGPYEFLFVFAALLFAASWVPAAIAEEPKGAQCAPDLDPYEAAILAGGIPRVAAVAAARLVDSGGLRLRAKRGVFWKTIKGVDAHRDAQAQPAGLLPIEADAWAVLPKKAPVSFSDVVRGVSSRAGWSEASLRAGGYLYGSGRMSARRAMGIALCAAIAALGFSRLFYGLWQGRPIGFLVFALAGCWLVGGYHAAKQGMATDKGMRALAALKKRYGRLGKDATARRENDNPEAPALAMGVALFGSAALMGSEEYAGINHFYGPQSQSVTGNSSSGGGCSSIGSGGSGDGGGGGCGGGGCGGCGG